MAKRTFKREFPYKKPHKIFVIATEGEKTEPDYFNGLSNCLDLIDPKIYIEVVKRNIPSESSPLSILKSLKEKKKDKDLRPEHGDELWIIIDKDRWGSKEISEVYSDCKKNKFNIALSNPCFELWLLLHFVDVFAKPDDEKNKLFINKKTGKKTECEIELTKMTKGYNKSKLNFEKFKDYINNATKNSKKLLGDEKDEWPNKLATQVHLLVEKLVK